MNAPIPRHEPRLLTRGQRQILPYIVRGFTAPEIAVELGVATASIAHSIARIRTRLGACNAAQLGAMIIAMGLVDPASIWEPKP